MAKSPGSNPDDAFSLEQIESLGVQIFGDDFDKGETKAASIAVDAVKNALLADRTGHALQCLGRLTPTIFYIIMSILKTDDWFKENVIIVCFNLPDGGSFMGFGLRREIPFWKAHGRDFLRSPSVRLYGVEQYATTALNSVTI